MGAVQGNFVYFWSAPEISMLTRFSREEVYEFYCNHWKKYENQKIDRKAFVEIYNSFTGAKITVEASENIFKSIDKKGNGNISLRDIMMAFNEIAYGSEEEKLRWAFKVYDTNNDGFISKDGLTDIILSFRKDFVHALQAGFESSREPSASCAAIISPRRAKSITFLTLEDAKRSALGIMDKVDDNRDGKVSWEEFKTYSTNCPDIIDLVRLGTGYKK